MEERELSISIREHKLWIMDVRIDIGAGVNFNTLMDSRLSQKKYI